MDVYSVMGLLGILFIMIGFIAFIGMVYLNVNKTSKVKLNEIREFHAKREYLNERLGTTDAIGTL